MRDRRKARVGESVDPAMRDIAETTCARLEALGLHVRRRFYGRGFCEIVASSSPRMITLPDGAEASGVALLLARAYDPPTLVFEQINSLKPGLGRQMVEAVFATLKEHPGVFKRVRVDDASPILRDGRRWWERVAAEHPEVDWRITHDELERRAALAASGVRDSALAMFWRRMRARLSGCVRVSSTSEAPAAASVAAQDFEGTRDALEKLARAFGYDPAKVSLRPQKAPFDYLGQSFLSEGEAEPDGGVVIYYDPNMSEARLGCCLAHEIQHARYFAVRAAFRAEPSGGPLHRRFAAFTPQILAAQRGVSAYSNEHWDAWRGASAPALFSPELEDGGSEPINETLADVARALFNWGPRVAINPVWKELFDAINEAYAQLPAS